MKVLALGEAISATAVAAQTAIQDSTPDSPFLNGQTVVGEIVPGGPMTAAGTAKIQGSDDNSTWTDLVTNAAMGSKVGNIKMYRYMRANVTVAAAGAGSTYSFYLWGN